VKTDKELFDWLRTKYPQTKDEPFRVIEIGHQNRVIVSGNSLVFRFPRTEEDIRNMKRELRVLPELQKRVNLPIPHFIDSSLKNDPPPYVVYPWMEGTPLSRDSFASLQGKDKRQLAKDLGMFLGKLHTFPIDRIETWDQVEVKKRWRKRWKGYLKNIYTHVSPHIGSIEMQWIAEVFDRYLSSPRLSEFQPALIHADFKPGHILYDFDKKKTMGVIDFGSLQIADPAFDFESLFLRFGEDFAREVLRNYTAPQDRRFFDRVIKFYAVVMPFNRYIGAIQKNEKEIIKEMKRWLQQESQSSK
jgi:aminoglycoside 2''-phosphotransferase